MSSSICSSELAPVINLLIGEIQTATFFVEFVLSLRAFFENEACNNIFEIVYFLKTKKIFNNTNARKDLLSKKMFLQKAETMIHGFSSCKESHSEFHTNKTLSDILMLAFFMASEDTHDEHISCILYRLCGFGTESIFGTFTCQCELIKNQIHEINKLLEQ